MPKPLPRDCPGDMSAPLSKPCSLSLHGQTAGFLSEALVALLTYECLPLLSWKRGQPQDADV